MVGLKRTGIIAVVLVLVGSVSIARPQENSADREAVKAILTNFENAWAKCDASALAALWIPDGDFVSPYGDFLKGRSEIKKFYAGAFAAGYCGSRGAGTIDRIRFVKNDVAVVDGTWQIQGAREPNGRAKRKEAGDFTTVAVKQGGKWRIAAHREMIPATGRPK